MTEPNLRDDEPRPADTDEAADIVRNDPALTVATDNADDEEADDED
jgi:hypothetical protein